MGLTCLCSESEFSLQDLSDLTCYSIMLVVGSPCYLCNRVGVSFMSWALTGIDLQEHVVHPETLSRDEPWDRE